MSYSASQPVYENATANGTSPSVSRSWQTTITLIAGATFTLDLRSYQNLNYLKNIQSVFIDNTANATPVYISSGQENILCPGNSQLRSPIASAPGNPVFYITGSGTVNITFANYQMPMAIVSVSNGGTQVVNDPSLAAIIANGALNAAEALYGNQDQITHGRAGSPFSGTLTVPGTTTIITGSPSCFLTHLTLTADPTLTLNAAGSVELSARFVNAGTIDAQIFSGGTVAPSGSGAPIPIVAHGDLNMIGALSGDTLEVVVVLNTATAVTNGSFRYFVSGGTTALL